ncbi:hypothetical protein DMI62_22315 [Escherichia coli]|nr:hypothetical protein [Escherichia coli]
MLTLRDRSNKTITPTGRILSKLDLDEMAAPQIVMKITFYHNCPLKFGAPTPCGLKPKGRVRRVCRVMLRHRIDLSQ